jgi:hypothetical protein
MNRLAISALLGAAVALAACDGGTGVRDANVSGKWLYHAYIGPCEVTAVMHVSESGSTLSGTVPPTSGSCGGSSGLGSLPADSSITVSGNVRGDSVTFTMHGWGSQLVHTAAVAGDSMSGTLTGAVWLQAGTPNGSFGARRYTTEVFPGRFQVALSGAVNDTIEGPTYANQYGPVFYYDDGTGAGGITKNLNVGGFPLTPGTYHIYDRTVARDSVAGGITYHGQFYRFRDGTATISSVAGGYFQGTFDANAYLTTDTTRKIRAVGGFHPHYYVAQ